MKYLKVVGLAVVAALALMAPWTGIASATELYSKSGTLGAGTERVTSLEKETTLSLASTSEEPIVTCTESEVKGKVTSTGSSTTTVKGSVSHLTFSGGCSVTVNQSKNGTGEVHHVAGTTNGTVTVSGFYVVIHSPFIGACNYGFGASNVHLGTLTGNTSGNATTEVNTIVTEQEPKRILCPDTTRAIASYVATSPSTLWVEAS